MAKLSVSALTIVRDWLWDKRQKLIMEEADLENKLAAVRVLRKAAEQEHDDMGDELEEALEKQGVPNK